MSINAVFKEAVSFIQSLPKDAQPQPSVVEKLKFYALYKQATVGQNNTTKPGVFDLVGKAKWDAWSKLGAMSKEQAMKEYIDAFITVAKRFPSNPQVTQLLQKVNVAVTPSIRPANSDKSSSESAKDTNNSKCVQIYGNGLSQPSRAVMWFCLLNNIPYKFHLVRLERGEQLTPEFSKINPNKKVPVIIDDGITVYESHTILRYLSSKYKVPANWYNSSDLIMRTETDMYLDWHHLNLRIPAMSVAFNKFIAPMKGITVTQDKISKDEKNLARVLKFLDETRLRDNKFLTGTQVTIADLIGYSEIAQLKLVKFALAGYPNIDRWMKEMERLPHFDKVHETMFKMIGIQKAKL